MKLYFEIIISIIILISSSCRPKNSEREKIKDIEFRTIQQQESLLRDSLSNHPLQACRLIDSLMLSVNDSTTYYYLQIIKAKALMFMSNSDSSMKLVRKASAFCHRNSENDRAIFLLRAETDNMKGNLFARNSVCDSAICAFRSAYHWCKQAGDRRKVLDICMNLADAYTKNGQYDRGSLWYRQALSLADSLQIPEKQRFPIYYGLAQVNMELHDFKACDRYYEKAGRFFDDMKLYEKHIYLNNRGNSYYFREDYRTALSYFNRLMSLISSYPNMEFERNLTMVNLGETHLLLNHIDSASYYLDKCHKYFKKEKNATALYYIDTQFIELALKNNNLALARKRLQEAVRPAHVEPNMIRIRNRYLQHYYEKAGDYKQAYYYQIANQRIDDSTRNERIRMRVAEIVQKYRQDSTLMKKEMMIREKENEVLHLNEWIYRGVFIILFTGAGLTLWIFYRKRKQEEEEYNLKMDITSLRLKNIRNRISPHFIFNVLNRTVHQTDEERKKTDLIELSKLMRRNLELTESFSVSLYEELDFVNTYINLEKDTLSDFSYEIHIDEDIDAHIYDVPAMMIQIPVENSIKHALREKTGEKRIRINISHISGGIEISITDNEGGYRISSTNKGTGTGMKVLTQTISLLNSYNTHPITMNVNNIIISNEENGCQVKYTIPYHYIYKVEKPTKHNCIWKRFIRQSS